MKPDKKVYVTNLPVTKFHEYVEFDPEHSTDYVRTTYKHLPTTYTQLLAEEKKNNVRLISLTSEYIRTATTATKRKKSETAPPDDSITREIVANKNKMAPTMRQTIYFHFGSNGKAIDFSLAIQVRLKLENSWIPRPVKRHECWNSCG